MPPPSTVSRLSLTCLPPVSHLSPACLPHVFRLPPACEGHGPGCQPVALPACQRRGVSPPPCRMAQLSLPRTPVPHTLCPTPYTPHPTPVPYTLCPPKESRGENHSEPLCPTPCSLDPGPYALAPIPNTENRALCTQHYTPITEQSTLITNASTLNPKPRTPILLQDGTTVVLDYLRSARFPPNLKP